MNDLVEWLRAQLDEDEQVAIAASPNTWKVEPWANPNGVGYLVVADYAGTPPAFAVEGEANAQHIARHDPARVLAEVDAKRRIVELHRLVLVNFDDHVCTECGSSPLGRPCQTLRLLALPYANHPGYREEWRPA